MLSLAAHARLDIAPSLLSRRRNQTACRQRSFDRERSVARGSVLFSCCILSGSPGHEARGRSFDSNSRWLHHRLLLLVHTDYSKLVAFICAVNKGNNNGNYNSSSNNNRAMTGTLTSVVSLTICLAMTTTSAFVLRVPKVTPPDPAWSKKAASSLGRPLGDDGGKMGAGGALSRGGGHDDAEPKKDVLPRVPSPEGYSGIRSRSTNPLHVFKGVEPGTIEGGNATVPIVGGVGGVEGKDWGVAAVPQDGRVVQRGSGRVTTTPDELSSHHEFFWGQWSPTAAAHNSVPTKGDESGGQRDVSTDEPVMTLEQKVNEALRVMIHDALSGRPASKTAVPEEAVNDAIGSMLHDAFSGRPASQAFSSLLSGGGGSEGGAAGGLREEPVFSEIESKSKTIDDDDSRLPVAYEDVVRAASEVPVDWSKVFHADNKAVVTRKAGNGRRRWIKNIWGRVRRKGC